MELVGRCRLLVVGGMGSSLLLGGTGGRRFHIAVLGVGAGAATMIMVCWIQLDQVKQGPWVPFWLDIVRVSNSCQQG